MSQYKGNKKSAIGGRSAAAIEDSFWALIYSEADEHARSEPLLYNFFQNSILAHSSLEDSLSWILAEKLKSDTLSADSIRMLASEAFKADDSIRKYIRMDLSAYVERDPACHQYCLPLLYFKGFHALQIYRVSSWLWEKNRKYLALSLQNKASEIFSVDIHPGAKIGGGIMIDHATSLVIGETAVIGDHVSMLHSVTLGGTGIGAGDRHPKIRTGVMIAAGATILGNIEIGEEVKVGAGSLVLDSVPPHTTIAGVPAKVVGPPDERELSKKMNQKLIRTK
ncbi:MAG: serine O-acetyltransferase [Porticoccus sp.]|jgi:serine O-acetyltransferase